MAVKLAQIQAPKTQTASTQEGDILSNALAFLQKDIQLFGNKFNDKKKEAFFLELSILFSAGVDLKTTLELIEQEQIKPKEKVLITKIKDEVIAGSTLANAIQSSGQFSAYEFYSIQIGEETGKLTEVLKSLALFYTNKIKQSRQVVSALSYPSIVLTASVGAIAFMMQFVVPMFSDIFKSFKGELPAITKVILSISGFMSSYFYIFVLFILGVVVFVYTQNKKEWFRKYSTMALIRIPLIGEIISKIYIARFCTSMALLTSSKVPIIRAIKLIKQMIGFYPIEQSLISIENDIMHGLPLHKSLEKFDIYPRRMVSLVKVGEEVNQLEMFFEKIGQQYTEDVEHKTGMISSFVEPIMIIFLGLVVGTILVAMYLPLFSIGRMMHG